MSDETTQTLIDWTRDKAKLETSAHPMPYRLVGEITAAQYDEAMATIATGLSLHEPTRRALYGTDEGRAALEHARWVLDRIDAGMLRVAEEPEAGE